VAFSPDGRRIVTASQDNTARVWDAVKGQELLVLRHTNSLAHVAFSPDGRRILTGSLDKTARVWDAATGRELFALKGHTQYIWIVAFSSDGQRIVTWSWGDKTARLWDAVQGQELLALNGVESAAFSSDGKRIFFWDDRAKVLARSAADGTPAEPNDPPPVPPIDGAARSADGFLHAVPRGDTIRVTDARRPRAANAWPLPDAAERRRYHTEQCALAEKEKQWFAATFHVGRLLLDAPDDVELKRRRDEALRHHAATVSVGPPVIELAK
jgi:hypothetical protein